MTSVAPAAEIVIGVDTHKHIHVAVAVTTMGARLAELKFPTTLAGLAAVQTWARSQGRVVAWAVEGTGSWGAGLARTLQAAGEMVIEVNRTDRHARRLLGGKSDPIDAEAAARALLAGYATSTPKTGDGLVEAIRLTRSTRSGAVKACTAAMNQLRSQIVTAPPALRDQLEPLTRGQLLTRCAALRPGTNVDLAAVVKRNLRRLAHRVRDLDAEIRDLTRELNELTRAAAPDLCDQHGVGPDTAAALLIAAGDNPHRLHSEAAFAALCGANPIPASSGKTTGRHRLNRGGDRQANAALHRIIVVRLKTDPETRAYMAAHLSPNGANKRHVMRCLKRYLARRLYPLILQAATTPQPAAIAA
jgi:transposase